MSLLDLLQPLEGARAASETQNLFLRTLLLSHILDRFSVYLQNYATISITSLGEYFYQFQKKPPGFQPLPRNNWSLLLFYWMPHLASASVWPVGSAERIGLCRGPCYPDHPSMPRCLTLPAAWVLDIATKALDPSLSEHRWDGLWVVRAPSFHCGSDCYLEHNSELRL